MLGQVGSKINFRYMLDNRKIFIANLSKGRIGEIHSVLLGALLVTGFELAVRCGPTSRKREGRTFFLYG